MASRANDFGGDFSIADAIGRTVALFRANPAVMIGLPLVTTLLAALAMLGAGFGVATNASGFWLDLLSGDGAAFAGLIGTIAVVAIIFIIIALVIHGALIATGAAASAGERLSVGQALARGLGAAPRLFLLALLFGLVFGVALVALTVVLGAGLAGAGATGGSGAAIGLVILLWIGMLVIALWLTAVFAATPGVSVVERRWPFGAVARGMALTRGARLRLVGLNFVVFALYFGVGVALAIVRVMLLGFNSFAPGANPLASGLVGVGTYFVISTVAQSMVVAFGAALQGVSFAALRDRRDGPARERLSEVFA